MGCVKNIKRGGEGTKTAKNKIERVTASEFK